MAMSPTAMYSGGSFDMSAMGMYSYPPDYVPAAASPTAAYAGMPFGSGYGYDPSGYYGMQPGMNMMSGDATAGMFYPPPMSASPATAATAATSESDLPPTPPPDA